MAARDLAPREIRRRASGRPTASSAEESSAREVRGVDAQLCDEGFFAATTFSNFSHVPAAL